MHTSAAYSQPGTFLRKLWISLKKWLFISAQQCTMKENGSAGTATVIHRYWLLLKTQNRVDIRPFMNYCYFAIGWNHNSQGNYNDWQMYVEMCVSTVHSEPGTRTGTLLFILCFKCFLDICWDPGRGENGTVWSYYHLKVCKMLKFFNVTHIFDVVLPLLPPQHGDEEPVLTLLQPMSALPL